MRRWLDRIKLIVSTVSSGSYRLDRIGIGLGFSGRNWLLCAVWFATGWMGRMDWMGRWWDGDGMEGPTLAGAGTGVPPLALEGRRDVGSGGWNQFCWLCKGA